MSDRMICPHCGGWIYLENDSDGSCDTCDTRMVAGQLIVDKSDTNEDRTVILLRAAKELLIKQKGAGILIDYPLTVHYDDTDCDGYCLIDDIAAEIDALDEKPQTVSAQEHNDLQAKYHKQRENEKKLYDKIVNWCKSLNNLEYSVSSDNSEHYPNPAEDTKILNYTQTADYVLNGVIGMCRDLLDLDFTQPMEVVEPEVKPKEKILPGLETGGGFMIPLEPVDTNNRHFVFCSKCNFGKYTNKDELTALCPICHTEMQRQDS